MVPCECGQQFNDLTDWKSHSNVTGHCCIYKCRKPSSAASIPGFAFEPGTSTFITHYTPASYLLRSDISNAPAVSRTRSSEAYRPLSYDAWKGLVSSRADPTESHYPLIGAWNAPAASTLHPPTANNPLPDTWQRPIPSRMDPTEGCSLLPNGVWKVPVSSKRQQNLAYQSPDGTIWPAPVPLTKSQAAAYYQSLSTRPALILTSVTPHPIVASPPKSATSPTSMPPKTPPATASTPDLPGPMPRQIPLVMKNVQSNARPYGCSHCKRAFRMEESLRQHYNASHPGCVSEVFGRTCDTCKKSFNELYDLEQHQRAKKHCYCNECTIIFEAESTAVQHFKTFHASQFWCCDCEQDFISEHALDQHLNNKVHRRIPCQVCEQDFGSKPALDRHIVVEHHAYVNPKRVFYPEDVYGCYICQRNFVKQIDLDQHLTSSKHHPLSDLGCVASDECKRRFVSPSALLHHLESGTCCSGIDRHTVNNLVQDNDTEHIIGSDPGAQSLLEYNHIPWEYSSSSGTPVFTPTSSTSSSPVPATITDNIGQQPVPFLSLDAKTPSFDTIPAPSTTGVLTPPSPRMSFNFEILSGIPSLHTNLSSCAHIAALFHCPGVLASSTPQGASPRHFTTLSGLAQHIESGACGEGSATLKKAMEFVQERLEKMGFGSIRLLK